MTAENEMGSGVSVRLASLEDCSALAALSTQLGYPASEEDVRRRLTKVAGNSENVIMVATLPVGLVIGWLNAYLCRLVESDLHAEIGGLVVDQQHRQSGVGRLLIRHVEQWAREHGCKAVTLRSNITREAAHAFYLNLGYEIVKTQHAFRKVL